jgi:hypothetical protein
MKLPEAPHDFSDLARPKVPPLPTNARVVRMEMIELSGRPSRTPLERAEINRIRALKYSRAKRNQSKEK